MVEENLPARVRRRRDDKGLKEWKLVSPHGAEYWSARDLQPLLGYNHWRSFAKTIAKAITSCRQSGNDPEHHFARARKVVPLGSGSEREVPDYHLSRFACYLIAQNGDPRKPEIAQAQKYFAIRRIGGTMPENLPPAEDIKQVRKRLKGRTPPLELNGPDARDISGDTKE